MKGFGLFKRSRAQIKKKKDHASMGGHKTQVEFTLNACQTIQTSKNS